MRIRLMLCAAAAAVMLAPGLDAQVPQLVSYQGRVSVSGVNFNGTGSFNFALVDPTGTISYWSNDGTNLTGAQPASAVSLTVTNGLYSVILGDTSKANMTAIPASVFSNSSVWLRVWFNDGTHGAQLLAPDQRITSVGYAIVAGSVTNGAVGLPQLGLGTISGQINCNLTDPTHTYVYLRGTSSLAYVGTPSGGNYPFQLTLVTPGTYTAVAHQSNGTETSTSVTVVAGQTTSGVTLGAVDTSSDINNCGSCGNVCSAPGNGTVSCVAGVCQPGCGVGLTDCSGVCTNTVVDTSNCGACGDACASVVNGTASCVNSACQPPVCNSGFGDCNHNGQCQFNISADPNNCGTCGRVCLAANGISACTAGNCSIASCNSGFANCDGNPSNGCETNVNTDTNNCGTCGHECVASNGTAACEAGNCAIGSCNTGFADCDGNPNNGCETNVQNNINHCGTCGHQCVVANGTPQCVSSTCSIATCNAGFRDCDSNAANGCETNIETDAHNCGGCGVQCATGHSCIAGVCN